MCEQSSPNTAKICQDDFNLALIDIGNPLLHKIIGVRNSIKPELLIQTMCIFGYHTKRRKFCRSGCATISSINHLLKPMFRCASKINTSER